MNYHGIESDSMLNGEGLRVCLWCSGCSHHCKSCHNPQTWDENSGEIFDEEAEKQLFDDLSKDYISGITFTGGDPLYAGNVDTILHLCKEFRKRFGKTKTIRLYTGYYFDDIKNGVNPVDKKRQEILQYVDVLVDGPFIEALADVNYPYAGSTNQHVIYLKKSTDN